MRQLPIVRRALAIFLLASTASATTVVLQRDGQPVEGGEVCRFAAGDRENPFKRWLSSQDVTCSSAKEPISFPEGLWNVFGRAAGSVSATPLLIDGNAPPDTTTISLDTAAVISARGVIYATRRVTAFPADGRTIVPAGEDLLLFLMEKGRPTAVIPIPAIEAGRDRTVSAIGGESAVIAWLQVPEADRAALRTARGVDAPKIPGADPLPPLDLLHGAFVRIRGLGAGEHDLEVGGRGWLRQRRRVRVAAAVTTVEEPLIARGSATLLVNWSAYGDLPALDASVGSCEQSEKPPRFELWISACTPPARPNLLPEPDSCSVVRTDPLPIELDFGAATVDDLVPGFYRAELRFGKLPPASVVGPVGPFQQRSLPVRAQYVQAYGSVTYGDDLLLEDMLIQFGRSGVGFASRDKGEYRAVLLTRVGIDAQVSVKACDGAPDVVVLTSRPMSPTGRLDIEIPANEMTVSVTDTFTRMALAGVTVKMTVLSQRPPRPIYEKTVKTDHEGRVTIPAVPPDRSIRLQATLAGYQQGFAQQFSMTKSEKKAVEIQMLPLRGERGRIVSQKPFENAAIFWHSPSGVQTEQADVGMDGTFVWARSHSPDETMTVVSFSHPLWILRAPQPVRREPLQIPFPDGAPVREFEPAGEVTLTIGGLRVHPSALRHHLTLRNLQLPKIRDIAETGPIVLESVPRRIQ